MRVFFLSVLALFVSTLVHAQVSNKVIPFAGVQEECVQVGEITFGSGGRWANCHVTRGRWVATIDFLDLYQAQYCLSKTGDICDKRAIVIFANRAYTPDATVLMVRMDDSAMAYDDPLVVINGDESVMSVSAHSVAGNITKSFFLWRADHWVPMKAQTWLPELSASIPQGSSFRQGSSWPDLETMSAQVSLFKKGDSDCCPSGGVADVELGLSNEQFTVKQVKVRSSSTLNQ
jgi:hypothetical protein